jgi:hypothetical protein
VNDESKKNIFIGLKQLIRIASLSAHSLSFIFINIGLSIKILERELGVPL